MNNKFNYLLSAGLASALLCSACGITADQVHKWGYNGQYERIRGTLSQQPAEAVRVAVAAELGKGDYPFGIPDLVTLTHDASYKVRAAAVSGLGQYAGAEVYNAIIQSSGDENTEVARAAEQVLRTWGEESTPFLIEAAEDRNYKVRAAAISILGRMSDRQVPNILLNHAQRDDNNIVRREAVRAIGNKGLTNAKTALYKIKNTDSSSEVSLAAEEALGKIGGNILDKNLLVVSFNSADDYLDKYIDPLTSAISSKIVANHLCEVKQLKQELGADLQNALLELGRTNNVDEVIGGDMTREHGKMTINLIRLDVQKGTIIQQESYTGLESQANQVIDQLTKRLISRFI